MKLKNYLSFFFFLNTVATSAQFMGPFSQFFDGKDTVVEKSIKVQIAPIVNNIWQIGKPGKNIFNSAASAPNVIVTDTINNYPPSNLSSFSFIVNTKNFVHGVLALRWKQKLDMKKDMDGGIIEYSANKGISWKNAFNNPDVYQFYGFNPANKDTLTTGEYAFSGTDTTWKDIWLCINYLNQNPPDTLLFKFTFKSTSISANTHEGWMIDNFVAHLTHFHPVKKNSLIEELTVYPSVTSGIVNVELKKTNADVTGIKSIEVMNVEGKRVVAYGVNAMKAIVDMTDFPVGVYYVKVYIGNEFKLYPVFHQKE